MYLQPLLIALSLSLTPPLVFAIVMSPTAVKGSLGSMKYFSVIAICLAIYLTAAVVGYSSSNAVTNQVIPGIESFLFSNKLFAVLPICLVSYSVHLNVSRNIATSSTIISMNYFLFG